MQPFGALAGGIDDPCDRPPQLMEPSYENRLRLIGRRLDRNLLMGMSLLEVDGGFVVRAFRPGNLKPLILTFPDADFTRLVSEAIATRGEAPHRGAVSSLLPTGYEDFLRALGHHLDEQVAENLTICELVSFVVVSGFAPAGVSLAAGYQPFSETLDIRDIRRLLDVALSRRGSYAPITHYVPAGLRSAC
jgi:hypothetical protein